jgi:ADP-L-glycero-D-manno-heptose 6-epimerase
MGSVVVTGAEGFIGSNLVNFLNEKGNYDIIIVDSADNGYLKKDQYREKMSIEEFKLFCIKGITTAKESELIKINAVYHLGAIVDTTSKDKRILEYNLSYSKILFDYCASKDIPLIYASSAAVYGKTKVFKEDQEELFPLNIYAESKYLFDKYALAFSNIKPGYWYGFRFFNVFGPNELHKGNMASAITQIYLKALLNQEIRLFRSIDPKIKDGHQMRDFINVKDVIRTIYSFYENKEKIPCGIYNLGTGKARSFMEIAELVKESLDKSMKIRFIDTPEELRNGYQSYTQADMEKTYQYVTNITNYDFDNSVLAHYNYLNSINKAKKGF